MKASKKQSIQTDWWSKSIFGSLLSLIFAIGVSNIFILVARPYIPLDILSQLGMWGIVWLWLPTLFMCFYFAKGWHMIVSMSIAIFTVYSLLFWLRG